MKISQEVLEKFFEATRVEESIFHGEEKIDFENWAIFDFWKVCKNLDGKFLFECKQNIGNFSCFLLFGGFLDTVEDLFRLMERSLNEKNAASELEKIVFEKYIKRKRMEFGEWKKKSQQNF